MGEGDNGYCGVRRNVGGELAGATDDRAYVSWYHDPLPTNCVADWVCPGGSGCGYPQWSACEGPEYGYENLAVFYEACSFDCLFCQNWHFKSDHAQRALCTAGELAGAVTPRTTCICFFGGDPGPQAEHAIAAAELALSCKRDRHLRICWETNGCEAPEIMDRMVELSLASGGCVKFDLKAADPMLHEALCGVSNARTFKNFARAASRMHERPEPPPVVASTLLVPGYVNAQEVAALADVIAGIHTDIPYVLLAFRGDFEMADLPCTSHSHAERALDAARGAGLARVRLGNAHLVSGEY